MRAVAFILAALFVTAAQTRPAFDVASVKPNHIIKGQGQLRYTPAGVDFADVSVAVIISEAYSIPNSRISSPDARNRELLDSRTMFFDVSARAANEVPKEQIKIMLQTLLSDRFKLVVHRDNKNESVYKLVVTKGGPKLQESKTSGEPTGGLGLTGFVLRNIDMPHFAGMLSQYQDRPVLDATGLAGTYDITLSVPEQVQATAEGKRGLMEWLTSSLFADIQRQLGLQLVPDKASVDYLVVDHVEMPSEN
jgi:uncharacterized protein (TIGR03435 family)